MASYGHLVRLLIEQPSIIGIAMLTSLWVGLVLIGIGAWLPWVWTSLGQSTRDETSDGEPLTVLRGLVLSLGGGMTSLVIMGTASAYLFRELLPGVLLSSVLGFVSIIRLTQLEDFHRVQWGANVRLLSIVTLLPFLLGVWLHQISEVRYDTAYGRGVAFGGLNDDNSFHVYLAAMVEEHGLPLCDLYGSPHQDYAPLVHTGHGVLIAATAQATGVGLFAATAALWTAGFVLIAWAGFDLLSRTMLSPTLVRLGCLSPLVLGPIGIPSVFPLWRPGEALQQEPLVAARMYWNLPQTISIALVAVSLICLAGVWSAPRGHRRSLPSLLLATLLIVTSGLVKPSLLIFYGPALLITLIVQRRTKREISGTVVVLALGVLVSLLPQWLVPLPSAPEWSVTPSLGQSMAVGSFVVWGCGGVLLLSLRPLRDMLSSMWSPGVCSAAMLSLVAMGGSLLFALLFREDRFVEHIVFQPNIWWGPSACAVLLIPWVMRVMAETSVSGRFERLVQRVGVTLLWLQVLNGIVFAVACPAINTRVYPQSTVEALERARESTSPATALLIDPSIRQIDLASILHRPALYATSYMSEVDEHTLAEWDALFTSPFDDLVDAKWSEYDAAIVANSASAARQALLRRGWSVSPLTSMLELWRRPEARAEDAHSQMGAAEVGRP